MSRTVLCLVLLHFCTVKSLPMFRYVIFGDWVTLACGSSCQDRISLIYEGYDGRTNHRTVAENATLDRFYEDRAQLADDGSSVNITRAEYHDKGVYVWTCGGDIIAEIKLDVWIPTEVSAAEGGNATVHCFIDTDEESVHWQRLLNGILVDLPQETGRSFRHGKEGHFILTLSAIQPADQGIYVCSSKDSRGEPKAFRVRVTKEASPGIESPTSSTPALWVVVFTLVFLAMPLTLCAGVRLGGNPPGGNPPGRISRAIFWIQGRPTPGASDQTRRSSLDTAETEQLFPPVEEEQKCSSVIYYSE